MDQLILSTNLQNLMKLHGNLSVSELSRQTSVPQPTLHHILSGSTKKPRLKALEALANFFTISITQLTGEMDLPSNIPNTIKNTFKITTVPLINWEMLKKWPEKQTDSMKEIVLDKEVDPNSFALMMKDSTMDPLFPQDSILILDPNKKPKDRDFAIVHFSQNDIIIFNRLFLDNSGIFIKVDQTDGNAYLLKLTSTDRIIGILIEARLQF